MRINEVENGEVIGYVNIEYSTNLQFFDSKSEVLTIESLVVHKGHRGKGLAKKLMNKALDFVKEYGCPELYLAAHAFDSKGALSQKDLVKFYEKFDFKVFNDNFGEVKPMKRMMK